MSEAWGTADVQRVLDVKAPDITITSFDASTATSQLAAEQIGCELGQIAKSIAFWVEERPVLVITSGDQRVDDRKLAAHFEVSRKKIRIASPDECIAMTGYAPGGVPPIAHRRDDITYFVDASLQRYAQIFAAAGAANAIMPVTVARLLELTGGAVADFARDVQPDAP